MSDNDNVVSFPKPYLGPPRNIEEAIEDTEYFKYIHIEEGMDVIFPVLLNQITTMGFIKHNWDDPNTIKMSMLISEAIKAFMMMHYEIDHPLQEFSTHFFNEDKDGNILINSENNIIFSRKEDVSASEDQKSVKE